MDKNYEKMFQQQVLLLERLTGETKRDYYVDLFATSLIQALKFRRKEGDLSQSEIARLMGVKQSYISKIENLEKVPTLETIARYCYALKFQADEIKILADELSKKEEAIPNFFGAYDNSVYWDADIAKHFSLKKTYGTTCSA